MLNAEDQQEPSGRDVANFMTDLVRHVQPPGASGPQLRRQARRKTRVRRGAASMALACITVIGIASFSTGILPREGRSSQPAMANDPTVEPGYGLPSVLPPHDEGPRVLRTIGQVDPRLFVQAASWAGPDTTGDRATVWRPSTARKGSSIALNSCDTDAKPVGNVALGFITTRAGVPVGAEKVRLHDTVAAASAGFARVIQSYRQCDQKLPSELVASEFVEENQIANVQIYIFRVSRRVSGGNSKADSFVAIFSSPGHKAVGNISLNVAVSNDRKAILGIRRVSKYAALSANDLLRRTNS